MSRAASQAELESICLNALGKRSGEVAFLDVKSGRLSAHIRQGLSRPTFLPGSTAKLVTAYAGLSSGAINTRISFDCRNVFKINGCSYTCTKPGGHGRLDVSHAISSSCNIWFYQAARKIGQKQIKRAWASFGIHLDPGTYPVERLAIGEAGIQITPVQMAKIARQIAINKDRQGTAYPILCEAMRMAVTHGTAVQLSNAPVAIAGKTGSPSHYRDTNLRHGWFIGFAPYDNPQIAVAVLCLEGNSYRSAVPVTRKILEGLYADR